MQFSCQVECFITALCWTTGHAPSCSLYSLCPVRIETSSASPMPWAMAVAVGRLQMLQSTVRWRCAAEPCHVVDAKSCLTGALSRKRCELREIWDLGTSVSKKIWRCDWIEIRYAISLGFQFLILIYMYTYIYISMKNKTKLSCFSCSHDFGILSICFLSFHLFPDLSATVFLGMNDLRSTCGFTVGRLDLQPGTASNWVDWVGLIQLRPFQDTPFWRKEEEGFSQNDLCIICYFFLFQKDHHHCTVHSMLIMILGHTCNLYCFPAGKFLESVTSKLCLGRCSVMFPDLWCAEVPGVWGKRRIPPVLGGGKNSLKSQLSQLAAMPCGQDATTCYWSVQQRSGKRRSAEREVFEVFAYQ